MYLTGNFRHTLTLGSLTLAAGHPDSLQGFVAKYSPSGVLLWATTTGSATRTTIANGCALASSGDLYIGVHYIQGLAFGPTTFSSAGSYDVFLARMRVAAPVGLPADAAPSMISEIYPNPAQAAERLRFGWPDGAAFTHVSLLDSSGRVVWHHPLTAADQSARELVLPTAPTGCYILRAVNRQGAQHHHRLLVE